MCEYFGREGQKVKFYTSKDYWVHKYLCLIMFLSYLFPPFSLNIHRLTLRDIISADHVHLGQIKCWTPLKKLEGNSAALLSLVKWSHSVVSDSLWPHGLWPTRLLRSWDSPGKNTGVAYHFPFQGIFPTQGLNPGFSELPGKPILSFRRLLIFFF